MKVYKQHPYLFKSVRVAQNIEFHGKDNINFDLQKYESNCRKNVFYGFPNLCTICFRALHAIAGYKFSDIWFSVLGAKHNSRFNQAKHILWCLGHVERPKN